MTDKSEQYEQLTAYHDGELSDAQRAEVERLLEEDAEAREVLESLRETSRMVASLPRDAAPADLVEYVTARLERGALLGEKTDGEQLTQRSSRWAGWASGLAVAAVVAVMCTAGWYAWMQHTVSEPAVLAVAELEEGSGKEDAPSISGGERLASKESGLAAPRSVEGRPSVRQSPDPMERGAKMRVAGVPSDSPNGDSRRRFAREDGKKGVHGDDDATADLFAAAAPPSRGPSISAGVPVETEPELRDATPEQAFGQLLAENVLTNLDVRAVPLDTISNRVAVTTDAETGARLISHINAYLGENHVQNLGEQPLPEPIGPTEAFYSLNQHPVERYVSTKSGSAPPTAEWRMNVRAPQARQLIREMDDIARANSATLAWSVNDAKVAGVDPVPEVVSQLSTNSLSMNDTPASLGRSVVGERVEEQGVAGEASETEVLARKDGAAAGCEKGKAARSTLRRARGTVVGGRDPAKGDLPEDRDPADTQPASDSTLAGGRGGARGRCSGMFGDAIQESDADAWVVLAVSLRSIPASSSTMTTSPTPVDPVEVRRQRPTATSPATSQSTRRPTSQPTQQPTARATTQGAAGG